MTVVELTWGMPRVTRMIALTISVQVAAAARRLSNFPLQLVDCRENECFSENRATPVVAHASEVMSRLSALVAGMLPFVIGLAVCGTSVAPGNRACIGGLSPLGRMVEAPSGAPQVEATRSSG
jgi:hypothetical protein